LALRKSSIAWAGGSKILPGERAQTTADHREAIDIERTNRRSSSSVATVCAEMKASQARDDRLLDGLVATHFIPMVAERRRI
jgi:hypothetical protein